MSEEIEEYNEDDYIDYDDQSEPMDLEKVNNINIGKYEFLLKDDIEKERNKKIEEFIQFSSMSKEDAELILINYNWNIDVLMNDWFDNMEKIKQNCGLSETKESEKKIKEFYKKNKYPSNICLICFSEMEKDHTISLKCNHIFCSDCFTEYLKEKLKDQLTVLSTRCPLSGCNYIVTRDIFQKCLENDINSLRIFNKCLMRNFTDSNSDLKLCPNPKCDIIVALPGHGMVEIKCNCGYLFCFKCLRESHRPCDCDMVEFWENKTKNEGENAKWLVVNTKQCPNCHKYIEKNQGCNHMTCRKNVGGCGYEFCWICLGEWKPHGSSYYECKKYNPTEVDKQKEKMRQNIKYELERYANYYDSYSQEAKNLKLAEKLNDRIEKFKTSLEKEKNQPHLELAFFDEALQTVIDCHRILKNTYIYGYFMKDSYISLYTHHQDLLRKEADLLHELLELDEMPRILAITVLNDFNKDFSIYKGRIRSLMSAITKFRENLLVDIENHPDYIDYNILKNTDTHNKTTK